MPIESYEVLEVISELSRSENLRVMVNNSVKGGIIAGCGGALGGMLLGPVGLAIGGAVGGVIASSTCGSFKPLAHVIGEMSSDQKEILVNRVRAIINGIDASDFVTLSAIILSGGSIRYQILNCVRAFIIESGFQIAN